MSNNNVNENSTFNKDKNINFGRMDKNKLVNLIYELRHEIVKVKTEKNKVEAELTEANDIIKKSEKKVKKAEENVLFLARKLSPTYRQTTISSVEEVNKLSLDQIINMILKDYFEEKKEYQERMVQLETKQLQYSKLLSEITNQQMKIVSYQNEEEKVEENVVVSEDDEVAKIKKALNGEQEEYVEDANFRKSAESMTSNEETHAGITYVDFDEVKSKIKEGEKEFLKIMGTKGLSLYPEIEEIMKTELGYTPSKVSIIYNNLRSLKVIDVLDGDNAVKTMLRKNGVRVLWINKEVGVPIYIDLFKTKPVKSEKEILIEENDNLQHGYSIKETCLVLTELGFLNVSMSRKENTIKLDGNKLWIPDIIADDPVSKKRVYFEIEFANHTKEEFEMKLTKANMKASTLRIITSSMLNKTKLIRKVETWLADKTSKTTSMTISVGTFDEMRNSKSWGQEYRK